MIEWARGRLRRVDVSCVFVRIALSGTRLVCVLNESARDRRWRFPLRLSFLGCACDRLNLKNAISP